MRLLQCEIVEPHRMTVRSTIDFEKEDITEWAGSFREPWTETSKYKRDLPFEGTLLYGVIPVLRISRNVWNCYVDFREDIMSHKQHYRNRDVPMFYRRCDFTTTDVFRTIISDREIKQVIVDPIAHQLLVDDFDTFEKDAKIASPEEIREGLVLTLDGVQIFADTYIPKERQWVNDTPNNPYARPQFIVVEPHFEKPYPPQEDLLMK